MITSQRAGKTRAAFRVVLAAAVFATFAGLVAIAGGPVQAQTAPNGYGGSASVDLVHLDAVEIPGTIKVADLSVAPADAFVSSQTVPGHAVSRATNLDLDLLSGTLPLTGLIVEAEQVAPPDNAEPVVEELLNLDANPLARVLLARATAHSRWPANGCVPAGTPFSLGQSEVIDPEVLTGVGGPAGTALLALDNQQGSTVFTRSTVGMVDVAGSPNKGIIAEAHTQLTAVTLFKGTTSELTINVIAPPVVTAIATGQPGGASVTYSEPILQIVQGGTVVGELNAADINQTVVVPNGILELKLGTLESTTAPDGTSASGTANLLSVTVLGAPLPVEVIAPLSIAAGTVSANVPVGGVDCGGGGNNNGGGGDNPLREVHKDASAGDVRSGGTFNYTVAVPNRGTCTLTGVKVTDTITGPAGSTISTTAPAGTVEGLKVTWPDIGPIAPNETKTLVITVAVPTGLPNGTQYRNDVVVSATCDGKVYEQPAGIAGPAVFSPGGGGCQISDSNMSASHREVIPGETYSYYVHVFNSGDSNCSGVKVHEVLDPQNTFVSCSDNCTNSGQDVDWVLGDLPPGSSRDLVVTVKAKDDAPVGQRIPGNAEIDSTETGAHKVSTQNPLVSGASVLNGPELPRASGVLAKTGASPVGALGSLAAAAWVALRRMRAGKRPARI
ncbi:MAG TPA: hypothetical protein VMY88_07515 [Acidimicrobiales bacterium]|nr:hypothetical protein [Acidimicrobiales bacterium]